MWPGFFKVALPVRESRFAGLFFMIALLMGCEDSSRLLVTSASELVAVPLDESDPDFVELIEELQESVRTLPSSAEMRGRLAMAYEVNEFETAAIAVYQQAEALDAGDFRWPYFRALLLAETGDPGSALSCLDRAIAIDAEYVPAWLYRGIWLTALGRYHEARTAFEHARGLGAEVNANAGLAQVLLAEDQPEEAVVLLEPLSAEVRHPHVYRLLGRAYQALGRIDDAKIALARGKLGTPLQWRDPLQRQKWGYTAAFGVQLVHAENLLRAGRFDEVVKVLKPLRSRGVEDDAVLVNLSLAYARTGQLERAFETLREGFAASPGHFRFHNAIATLYREQDDIERAIHHLRMSISQHPTQAWPYERLGELLRAEGRYQEALAAFDKALDYGTDNPEAMHYNAGLLEGVLERWPEAIARFERAVALNPSFTMAYVHLARCLAEAGRLSEARPALAWAERLDTHPEDVASARRRLADLEAGRS